MNFNCNLAMTIILSRIIYVIVIDSCVPWETEEHAKFISLDNFDVIVIVTWNMILETAFYVCNVLVDDGNCPQRSLSAIILDATAEFLFVFKLFPDDAETAHHPALSWGVGFEPSMFQAHRCLPLHANNDTGQL